MDSSDSINIARRYAIAIEAKYGFVQLFLFGSSARGNLIRL